ncbi:ABC-2 transporter permease [Lachnospiraceae bacterium 54-53]
MKGMLIKDFMLLKNQKNFFMIICLVVAVMYFTNMNSVFAINYMTLMITMFTISTISYDEFDNGFSYLFTLPVSRKGYVAEKYLFGLITGGAAWCAAALLTAGAAVLKQKPVLNELFPSALIYLLLVLVLLTVSLPLHLKFGAEKSRMALLGVFGIVFAAVFCIVRGMRYLNYNTDVILAGLRTINPSVFMGGLGIVCVAAFIFSYFVSVRIMEKKQF